MDIYLEYGFSYNKTINVVKPGKSGADEIKAMMENYRKNAPKSLDGSKIVKIKDFKSLEAKDAAGKVEKLDMPETSNVLQFYCEDGTKVSVRPSGTEPKIKFYVEATGKMSKASDYLNAVAAADKKVDNIAKDLGIA